MKHQNRKNWGKRGLLGGLGCGCGGLIGCPAAVLLFAMIIVVAAGSILGWLFGGGAPSGQGDPKQKPSGQVNFWTPTPIPDKCFITPTPVAITATPAPVNTPAPGETPMPTSTGGAEGQITYLPTATPCPTPKNGWSTPDPSWTPEPPGVGPHFSPYRPGYNFVITQNYGCTDFPEFFNQACANANGTCQGCAFYFHRGLDLVGMSDKLIYSTMSGRVIYAGWGDDGFGNRVYVQQGSYLTIYPHMAAVYVGVGQTVSWGQIVGLEGSTGYSTGSHLHYEIHINGAWVDPDYYLYRQ